MEDRFNRFAVSFFDVLGFESRFAVLGSSLHNCSLRLYRPIAAPNV